MRFADYRAYLDEYPKGADRDAVRFHLGEAQMADRPEAERRPPDLDRPGPRPRHEPRARRPSTSAPGRSTRSPGRTTSPSRPRPNSISPWPRSRGSSPMPQAHPLATRAAYEIGEILPQPRPGRRRHRGVHGLPQGGGLPGRNRRGPPRPGRPGDDRHVRRSPGSCRGQSQVCNEAIAAWKGYLAQVPKRTSVGRRPAGDHRHPTIDDRRRCPRPREVSRSPRRLGCVRCQPTRSILASRRSLYPGRGFSFEREKKYAEAIGRV